jgi:HEAT repeat protein
MSKQVYDKKLEAIEALKREQPAAVLEPLRKSLKERNNFLVSKAAAVAEALGMREVIPDLVSAFERFFEDPIKTDPQCWAKNALAKALKNLEHDDASVFLRGLRHQQWEPVWGGREDSAITLRGTCAHALTACGLTKLDMLGYLTDLLVDHSKAVRVEAVRAIGAAGGLEGALLIRLKARAGDGEAEVTGQCLSAMVSLGEIGFVIEFLAAENPDVRMEAAAALAESREPEAFVPLAEFWKGLRDPRDKRALLQLLAVSPSAEAGALLRRIGEDESDSLAAEALAAWQGSRHARGGE